MISVSKCLRKVFSLESCAKLAGVWKLFAVRDKASSCHADALGPSCLFLNT